MINKTLFLSLSFLLFSAGAVGNEPSEFSDIKITRTEIFSAIPSFRNMWPHVVEWKGVTIHKQDDLFSMDGVQYRDIQFNKNAIKMDGYAVKDYSSSLQNEGFLSNKIRLMAGMPPISSDDNRPVMLCKIENHIDDEYYEMSFSQYNTLRKAFPSNYDMGHLCVSGQVAGSYWKARLSDFYDEFGNKL